MALASPTSALQGDVHIPPCGKDRCRDQLQKITKALKEKKLECVTEYGLSGRFTRGFEEAFENCSITVMHKCRQLWEKIAEHKTLVDLMISRDDKVTTVNFAGESRSSLKRKGLDGSEFYNFFYIVFMTQDISDDKKMSLFAQRLETEIRSQKLQIGELDRQRPQMICQVSQQSSPESLEAEDDNKEENMDRFEPFPDFFGESSPSRLFIGKEFLTYTQQEDLKFGNVDDCAISVDKLNIKMTKDQLKRNAQFILHKVLPKMYKEANAIGLTYIAICHHEELHHKATVLLQLLLFNGEKQFDVSTLIVMESLLFQALLDLPNWKETENQNAMQRLSNLYMIVVCTLIMSNSISAKACDMHLETVRARKLLNGDRKFSPLKTFLEEITRKLCLQFRKEVSGYQDSSADWSTQIAVVCETLKGIYKTMDTKKIESLAQFVTERKNIPEGRKTDPRSAGLRDASTFMILQGLILLLLHGLRKAQNKDPTNICKNTLGVLKEITGKNCKEVEPLLFEKIPLIREEACELEPFNKKPLKLSLWLQQVKRMLSPILDLDESKRLKQVEDKVMKSGGRWELVPGRFNDHDVIAHVHLLPKEILKNKTSKDFQDMYHNEMTVLLNLHHRNIIQMYAFQNANLPHFYIVEDYCVKNLQVLLENKRRHEEPYILTDLLRFLLDAATGLMYCHDQDYVHCNLTCQSLFMAEDGTVKLSGFQICQKVTNGKVLGKNDDPARANRSMRWTAPESLKSRTCTKESDCWMFGHLAYELLLHGVLPYDHLSKDEDAFDQILKGRAKLDLHKLKREHYELICRCAEAEPSKRLTIKKIRHQIEGILQESSGSALHGDAYPDTQLSSEQAKEGPAPYTSQGIEDQDVKTRVEILTDTITKFFVGDDDYIIIKEKIIHEVDTEVIFQLENGSLQGILPKIKYYQNADEHPHTECQIPITCEKNLLDLAKKKGLGESLRPYLECVHQVAVTLKQLHDKSWVLGDMCASNLYVDLKDQNLKVYVVSVPYLHVWNGGSDSKYDPPEDEKLCSRAAPEVMGDGRFSPESDVYCFGNLIYEVLKTFDQPNGHVPVDHDNMNTIPCADEVEVPPTQNSLTKIDKAVRRKEQRKKEWARKMKEEWMESHKKPGCCSDELYDLMKKCTVQKYFERIKLDQLIAELGQVCRNEFGSSFDERDKVKSSDNE